MYDFTPAKALKPGMRVQVTPTGHRAVTPSEDNALWTVKSACPARFGGKAGTEIEFANGVIALTPANANWIWVSVLPEVDLEAEAAWFTKRFGSD